MRYGPFPPSRWIHATFGRDGKLHRRERYTHPPPPLPSLPSPVLIPTGPFLRDYLPLLESTPANVLLLESAAESMERSHS